MWKNFNIMWTHGLKADTLLNISTWKTKHWMVMGKAVGQIPKLCNKQQKCILLWQSLPLYPKVGKLSSATPGKWTFSKPSKVHVTNGFQMSLLISGVQHIRKQVILICKIPPCSSAFSKCLWYDHQTSSYNTAILCPVSQPNSQTRTLKIQSNRDCLSRVTNQLAGVNQAQLVTPIQLTLWFLYPG